ncbi:unnamed protein product, partial [Prorocentrum cordatum]
EVQVLHGAVTCSDEGCVADAAVPTPLAPKYGWGEGRGAPEHAGDGDADKVLGVVPEASTDASIVAGSPGSFVRRTLSLLGGEKPQWQWKHRTGWKDYDRASSDKIEAAFQRGHPKARLKAGKKSSNPMEIFFADMLQHDAVTGNSRDVRRVGADPWWDRLKRYASSYVYAWDTGLPRTETLETAKARKKLIEAGGVSGGSSQQQVHYYSSGPLADVARSKVFQGFGTFLVALNAIWIAIELDNKDEKSSVGFQLVEHAFCALFSLEIAIRFAAYRRKWLCLKDRWFCFDTVLVLLVVLDSWLLPIAGILAGPEHGDAINGDFTVLRVARLLRLTRMARLLKTMPMMMTLLRGITTSIRPVSIAVGLLMIIIYIFSIIFRSLVSLNDPGGFLEREYFPSVTYTMLFLLLHGTFLDSVGTTGFHINREGGVFMLFVFLFYIFATSFLMLNMLIRVVCEMVSMVKSSEDEALAKVSLESRLCDIMEVYDADAKGALNQSEFDLFVTNIEVVQSLRHFDVDIKALITLADMMFSHVSPGNDADNFALGFDDIMSLAVRLKGNSACRVEDIVKMREFTKYRLQELEETLVSNNRMLEEHVVANPRRSQAGPAETVRSQALQ